MKEDLQSFLNENKEIKAIVMGTRSTDPSGSSFSLNFNKISNKLNELSIE